MAKRVKDNKNISFEITEEEKINRLKETIRNILHSDVKVVAKNESQKTLIKLIKEKSVVICDGIAGSGKTYVSLIYALSLIKNTNNPYTKIYLVKSVKQLKDEEIGYIKGDINEKLEPPQWSYFLNLEKIIDNFQITNLLQEQIIRPFPLAFIRGVNLDNSIVILDEAQNLSLDNIKTLMTRVSTSSKLLILGDINQIDLKNKKESGLKILMDIFNDVDEIGVIKMDKNDINIRNPLITLIEEKINDYQNGK